MSVHVYKVHRSSDERRTGSRLRIYIAHVQVYVPNGDQTRRSDALPCVSRRLYVVTRNAIFTSGEKQTFQANVLTATK